MPFTDVQKQQRQFLRYLRKPLPENLPCGFESERVAVYVDLLHSKFDESLSACFPVLQSILSAEQWYDLVKDFIAQHRCLSPYYRQIPDEFVYYLQHERHGSHDLPFLAELAHFEWTELVLSIAESKSYHQEVVPDDDLLDSTVMFVPVKQYLHYCWPVQRLSKDYQPRERPVEKTLLLGFRSAEDKVRFIEMNAMTVRFVSMLEGGFTGRQALQSLHEEVLQSADFSHLLQFSLNVVRDLQQQGAIIGRQRAAFD